jgi:hypothetical protein
MSDLLAVWCPDADVREAAKLRAIGMLEEFGPHFEIHEAEIPNAFLLVAANRNTPWKLASDAGVVAAVIGFPGAADLQAAATTLLRAPARTYAQDLCRRLNYGAAVRVDADGSLLCTTDYLGIYPLYVHAGPDLTVCASALPLFGAVPRLALDVDNAAIAHSLLLAHYLFGETVYRQVFRADARTVVEIRKGTVSRHRCALPDVRNVDERHVVDEFHEVLGEVSRELLPRTRATLMSGGLDSRLMSGYLAQTDVPGGYRGVTIGDASDFDVRFGAKVIHHLGFEPHNVPIQPDRFFEWLRREAQWDGAQSGGYALHLWAVAQHASLDHGPVATGLFGDAVIGAKNVSWAFDPRFADHSFETLYRADNVWGLPARIVRRLMRDADAVDGLGQCVARLGEEFDSYGVAPWKNAWWFHALHRQRFLIGRFAKLLAYRSWPVMPFMDHRVREYFDSLPLRCVRDRALQFGVVVRKFPALARLPLDRGNMDTRSVVSGLQPSRLPWSLQQFIGALRKSLEHRVDGRLERCFHDRMFDMNTAGWRAVRSAFADVIELASAHIDASFARQILVERVWPPGGRGAIAAGSGRRAVMSAICWMAMKQAPEDFAHIVGHATESRDGNSNLPGDHRVDTAVGA